MSDPVSWLWWGVQGLWVHLREISVLLGGIASVAGYYFYHWKAELADPASLEKLRPYLDDLFRRDTYRRTLDRALDAADWFFGPPVSLRAFGVCLAIAIFYPTALFLVVWVLEGSHTFGGVKLLPGDWPIGARGAFFGGLLVSGYGGFLIVRYREKIDAWTDALPVWIVPEWASDWRALILASGIFLPTWGTAYKATGDVITSILCGEVVFVVMLVIAGGRAEKHAGASGLPSIFVATVYVFISGSNTAFLVFVSVAGIFSVLSGSFIIGEFLPVRRVAWVGPSLVASGGLVGAVAYMFADPNDPFSLSYVVFFFALPLLNAILDVASWAVSRRLGREMLNRDFHRWSMAGFALIDLVCAFAFLCGLAVLLVVGGEALNRFAGVDSAIVKVDELVQQVSGQPFGDGLWIILMLLSTLVPTALHAFIAIGSVVQLRGRAEVREQWREEADAVLAGEKDELDPHTRRKIAEHWLWGSWLPSVALFLVLLAAGWFAWQASVLPDALLAAVEWGRSLVG